MSLLKTALRLNAVSCIGFGVLFSVVPGAVAAYLGQTRPAPSMVILILGIGLILNGIGLFLAARARHPSGPLVLFFSTGDFLWVLATIVLIVMGIWIETTAGIIAALLVAAVVGLFGLLQLIAWGRREPG